MKKKIPIFNDGFLYIYEYNIELSDFGAKRNINSTDDLTFITKLAYMECSKRIEDMEFCNSNAKLLNLKVKSRLYELNNNYKVMV